MDRESRAYDDFDSALRGVDTATGPTDLFGPPPRDGRIPPEATTAYRRLARLLHPDTAPARRRNDAADGFTRLTDSWRRYRNAVQGGPGPDDLVLTTEEHTYHVDRGRPLAEGDIADLRAVRYRNGDRWRDAVLKLPRAPRDNDLVRAEAHALRRLHERGAPRHRAFRPELVGTLRHRDPDSRVERHGNVLRRLSGFHDLAEVRRAHPGGVHPRDAAWMWRRLLVAIGDAHRAGVVHGAVVPEHVLIHPDKHGLVLVDWCYSVTLDSTRTAPHVPAMVPHRKDMYPPEVAARLPARPATDVYMATRCVEFVTAGRLPRPLAAFARGSSLPAPERRPSDAFALLDELDQALERTFGPPRFHPFRMPH